MNCATGGWCTSRAAIAAGAPCGSRTPRTANSRPRTWTSSRRSPNILADAIQQRTTEDDIRYQALHDLLTGLPNRVLFLDRLDRTLARRGAEVAVVLLDIDHFKLVNDSLGHSAGDALLWRSRPGCGGAEARDTSPASAATSSGARRASPDERGAHDRPAGHRRLRQPVLAARRGALRQRLDRDRRRRRPQPRDQRRALFRDADAAMYRAKERGRGRSVLFDAAMRRAPVERRRWRRAARSSRARGARASSTSRSSSLSGEVICARGAGQLGHRERGLIGPVEFVPIAEDSGLIEPIGAGCSSRLHQGGELAGVRGGAQGAGGIRQPLRPPAAQRDLPATIAGSLAATGLDPVPLPLEITESVLVEEPAAASATLERSRSWRPARARRLRHRLSSLAISTGSPPRLKVDRSFVTTSEATSAHRDNDAIVGWPRRSRRRHRRGGRDRVQATALRELECELAQGFHFHRPLDHETLSRILAEERPRAVPRRHHPGPLRQTSLAGPLAVVRPGAQLPPRRGFAIGGLAVTSAALLGASSSDTAPACTGRAGGLAPEGAAGGDGAPPSVTGPVAFCAGAARRRTWARVSPLRRRA